MTGSRSASLRPCQLVNATNCMHKIVRRLKLWPNNPPPNAQEVFNIGGSPIRPRAMQQYNSRHFAPDLL